MSDENLEGLKDSQSVTPDWGQAVMGVIEGVRVLEAKNVIVENGFVTELFRDDWVDAPSPIGQVFLSTLGAHAISAWHRHVETTDRLACIAGRMRIVLYDGRASSPTHGTIREILASPLRPTTLVVPPGVWHGIQNLSTVEAVIINMVDLAYCYADPDHWRLPPDTDQIPYRFNTSTAPDPLAK